MPVWVTSDKQEVGNKLITRQMLTVFLTFHFLFTQGARTIRKKIHDKLDEFLTEYPPIIKHPYSSEIKADVLCSFI